MGISGLSFFIYIVIVKASYRGGGLPCPASSALDIGKKFNYSSTEWFKTYKQASARGVQMESILFHSFYTPTSSVYHVDRVWKKWKQKYFKTVFSLLSPHPVWNTHSIRFQYWSTFEIVCYQIPKNIYSAGKSVQVWPET